MTMDPTGDNHPGDGDLADVQLINELREVVEHLEPIPELSTALARAAYEFRSLDAELAQLIHDLVKVHHAGLDQDDPRCVCALPSS